jgi:hypothetical protein
LCSSEQQVSVAMATNLSDKSDTVDMNLIFYTQLRIFEPQTDEKVGQ